MEEKTQEKIRIEEIINKKFDELIKYRKKTIKNKNRILKTTFNRLRDDILFLINNPNYVRKSNAN